MNAKVILDVCVQLYYFVELSECYPLGVAQKSQIFMWTVPYISGNTAAKFQRKKLPATPQQMPFYICT